jgi:hypothetical protein
MTILEHDPALYELIATCLRGDYVSSLRDQPTGAMLAGLARSLESSQVGELHTCGGDCRSFKTTYEPPIGTRTYAIRFHVLGELHAYCDAEGNITRIQYLAGGPSPSTKLQVVTPEGFRRRAYAGETLPK